MYHGWMQFSRISNLRYNTIGGNPRLICYSSVDKISTSGYIVSVIERNAMDKACVIYQVKTYCMENSFEYKDKVSFHGYIYLSFFEITFIRNV